MMFIPPINSITQIIITIGLFDLLSGLAVNYTVTLKTTGCQHNCDESTYDDGKTCPSSIMVDNKEMSTQKDGFNIVNLRSMETGSFRWFNATQTNKYDEFERFFLKIKQNTVVLIVFENMCGSLDKLWYKKLSNEANIAMDFPADENVLYNIAIIVGCKGKCGVINKSYYNNYKVGHNFTLTLTQEQESSKRNDTNDTKTIVLVVVILLVVLLVGLVLWKCWRGRKKNAENVAIKEIYSQLDKNDVDDYYVDPKSLQGELSTSHKKASVERNEYNVPSKRSEYKVPSNVYKVPSNVPRGSESGEEEYMVMNDVLPIYPNVSAKNIPGENPDNDAYVDMNAPDAYIDMSALLPNNNNTCNEAVNEPLSDEDDEYEIMDLYSKDNKVGLVF